MDLKKIQAIKDKYDNNLDELMMHVEAIRKLAEEFNAVEYIRELSTEIMSTNDEYVEELDQTFKLSLFDSSEKCDVCWIVDITKDAALKFITQLDEDIEKKIIEYDSNTDTTDPTGKWNEDLLDEDDDFNYRPYSL